MKLTLKSYDAYSRNIPLVFGIFKEETYIPFKEQISPQDAELLELNLKNAKKELGSTTSVNTPSVRCIVVGLGEKKSWDRRSYISYVRAATQTLKDNRISQAQLLLREEQLLKEEDELQTQLAAENIILSNFAFLKYKKAPEGGHPNIDALTVLMPKVIKKHKDAFQAGITIGEATNSARILANTPGGEITPKSLAKEAQKAGKSAGFKVSVWTERKIKSAKMGGIMGVSQGSTEAPRFIVMTHKPKKAKNKKPLVLIGKGVTFDTGGLNVKPGDSMYEMHLDMSGGAAVIGAMTAIAQLDLPVHVIGLVPAVENMPSGQSYRPGDILTTYNGKTVEVVNTDAEGRLILADALGYAVDKLDPALIVDVATLTGAAMVALGQRTAGLFTNRDNLELPLRELGETTGDYVWPLPTWDEYAEDIKGTFADVRNLGKTRYGGAITAALFLKQFIDDRPWVHLDIAPTMTSIDDQRLAKGATGAGVRMLTAIARSLSQLPV